MENLEPQRIQKLLAHAGVASRRVVEDMIEEGRITLNGSVVNLGEKATVNDEICVDDIKVPLSSELVWFLLNKPLNILSSSSDDRGRKTVVDIIDTDKRIFPVGRLDINTTGLLILTNDGELTNLLTHPKYGVSKTYVARLDGHVQNAQIETLQNGVELDDGMTSPAKVKVIARKSDQSVLEIIIHEGRNRQIRRMASAIGHEVLSLQRIAIGPIVDKKLKTGEYRKLEINEILTLNSSIHNTSRSN
ncbi:MAG: pseudouridine synthase [Acidimicrobiia bacterium]